MMLGKTLFTLLLLSTTASASQDDNYNDDAEALLHHRKLLGVERAWYERMKNEDTTGLVKRCTKKSAAPGNGTHCSRREKVCFFGTEDCDGVGSHPKTTCHCDGAAGSRTWKCVDEPCPKFPDPERTGCPEKGEAIDHDNDSRCPIDSPLQQFQGTCTAEQDGASCSYGQESCCGQCHAEHHCRCDSGQWGCMMTDACMHPSCSRKVFVGMAGKTCVEARTEVFATYPGMQVICLKESDPNPDVDDFNRYIVYTDDSEITTKVLYNRHGECPETKVRRSCHGKQQCSWTTETTSETEVCQSTESCTCVFGSWRRCTATMECVSANPPSVESPP